MSRWEAGQTEVAAFLANGWLQAITGAATDGQALLDKADQTIRSASSLVNSDPDNAYTLAYDAARLAGTALLAQQGLRPTSQGGHYVVELVLRAQFGQGFKMFAVLRRRRNELEYPNIPEAVPIKEAQQAITDSHAIITSAKQLIEHLDFFR
jgi:recombinational DNA repair protein RecT